MAQYAAHLNRDCLPFAEWFSRLPVKHQTQSLSRDRCLSESGRQLLRAISHSDRRVGDRGLARYRLMTSIFIQYWLARQKVSKALVRIAVLRPGGIHAPTSACHRRGRRLPAVGSNAKSTKDLESWLIQRI